MSLGVNKELYYTNFSIDNPNFKRTVGILLTMKSFRFFNLFMLNGQIRAVFGGFIKSLPFLTDILLVIGVIFLLFGTLGISIYGGNINSGSPEQYQETYGDEMDENLMLFNFNDYYHSFLTLFMIMQIGWFGFDKTNTLGMKLTFWHNVFFFGFFFMANVIFNNILFGFLVDNTTASIDSYLSKLEKEEEKTQLSDQKSHKSEPKDDPNDGDEENRLLDEEMPQ